MSYHDRGDVPFSNSNNAYIYSKINLIQDKEIIVKSKQSNSKIVLYLGAGASHFAKYFTFTSFPDLLFNDELRNDEGMPPLSPEPKQILSDIRQSLEKNSIPTTHDNFLWRLDGYTQLLRLNRRDDVLQKFLRENTKLFDLHNCTEQALQQITATTVRHYSFNRVENSKSDSLKYQRMLRVYNLYREMAKINADNFILPVFTTNYDMLLEDLIREFGKDDNSRLNLINGIPDIIKEQATWNSREYERKDDFPSLHLYRLHGCVCWFYHNQGDASIYFHRRDAVLQETVKLCAMYPGRETQRGVDPHGLSFHKMYRSLQDCEIVVFIGFSFRDDDVMHLLLKVLSERIGKPKLLIVDPTYNSSDIQNKLRDAAQRSTFPVRIPKNSEIRSLSIHFGDSETDDKKILETCHEMLTNGETS